VNDVYVIAQDDDFASLNLTIEGDLYG